MKNRSAVSNETRRQLATVGREQCMPGRAGPGRPCPPDQQSVQKHILCWSTLYCSKRSNGRKSSRLAEWSAWWTATADISQSHSKLQLRVCDIRNYNI